METNAFASNAHRWWQRRPCHARTSLVMALMVTILAVSIPAAQADSRAQARDTATMSPDQPRPELQRALDAVVEAGAVGVQAEVIDQARRWVATSGRARLNSRQPVPANGRFRVGSVTKSFTATVLMQLVAEGRVRLHAPIERYLPNVVPNGENITVRQILNHTSGLFNYVEDPEVFPMSGKDFLTKVRFHTFTADEEVQVATAHPPLFPPGEDWWYSNTNYVLASMIIERVTGSDYGDEVERRIILPLGLRHTYVPGTRTAIPGPHAHGYMKLATDGGTRFVDVTRQNPSWAGAAGEIISTTHDLNRFYSALFGGRLLPPAQLDAMLTTVPYPEPDWRSGLGIAERRLPCGATVLGFDGGIHGFSTYSFHSADRRRQLSMSVTLPDSFIGGDQALFTAIEDVVPTALCDGSPPAR